MRRFIYSLATLAVVLGSTVLFSGVVYADQCGGGDQALTTSIDFGCRGEGASPILDLTFAIIRFLSAGVGVILIGSTVVAGIQYTTSRGDPSLVAKSKERLRANAIALLFFVFGFSLINYIIPGQIFAS